MVSDNSKVILYKQKDSEYFDNVNPYVLALIEKGNNYLEIGCGNGNLAAVLRERNLFNKFYGIEIDETAARQAKGKFDVLFNEDLDVFQFQKLPKFDSIVCADVLEHVVDPWTLFKKITQWITDNGSVIISLPNARHIRVWYSLVISGKFEYQESGLMDKGHLRFFTYQSIADMVSESGCYIEKMERNITPRMRFFNALTLGVLKDFITIQYIIRLKKKS